MKRSLLSLIVVVCSACGSETTTLQLPSTTTSLTQATPTPSSSPTPSPTATPQATASPSPTPTPVVISVTGVPNENCELWSNSNFNCGNVNGNVLYFTNVASYKMIDENNNCLETLSGQVYLWNTSMEAIPDQGVTQCP